MEQSRGHPDVAELKLPASSPWFGWMEITRIYSLRPEFHYFPAPRKANVIQGISSFRSEDGER